MMIVVLVVHGEFLQFFTAKFPSAPGADPGEQLERSFPVGQIPLVSIPPAPGNVYAFLSRFQIGLL